MTQALAYANLPDVDFVQPRTEADEPLFRELAKVLKKHGALNRFGITLLHTHFPINEGEVLLETTDKEKREQFIRPVRTKDIEEFDSLETSWRLGPEGEILMACRCLYDPKGQGHVGHLPTG